MAPEAGGEGGAAGAGSSHREAPRGARGHTRTQPAPGRRARHRGHGQQPVEAPAEATAGEGAGAGEAGAAGEPQLGASPAARVRERPKPKHKRVKEPKHPKGPVPAPEEKKQKVIAAAVAPVIPIVAVSAAPAVATAPPAPPVAVTPRVVVGSAQSFSGGSPRATGRPSSVRPRRHAGSATTLTPPLPPAAAASSSSAAATPVKAPARKRGATAPSGGSQLVTTVTKLVNVIPPFVRILIAALVALALALGVSSRVATMRARRLARQRTQLLEDVGLLQAALLPPTPPRLGPVATSSAYRPTAGPGAGGDFYDVFALADGQLAVIVGDVSGHGRIALPQTTLVRYTLRAYLEAGMQPRAALQMAAPVLERQLGDSFATVVLATYHPRERTLVYACAGHPPPVVLGSEPIVPVTACSSPPIGAGQPTGMRQTVVSLPGEAVVCFYTDGVLDARVGGELFGGPRLKALLEGLGRDANAGALLDRVAAETDQRPDDMAACVLRIEGSRSAPRVQAEELELDRREVARGRAERLLLARGLEPAVIEQVLTAARRAVDRDGAVVLEVHLGDRSPEVALREQNVRPFEPTIRASSRALEMSG
ncbi:MAG TPA: PP2C family protein-serine/threonine phosphatase [Solirubrobacteraceae bacterium]|nr:PP2C family protein-serine/threonine phosphatase [Solirubrobacteraceae bacterium]